ncbi:MAG: histidine kinase [Acidobacteriaceae bacterium]
MSSGSKRLTPSLITIGVLLTAGMLCFSSIAYLHSPQRGLPYRDSFATGSADEWQAFGGTWAVAKGRMRNDSDERGAKLIAGSSYWKNYSLDADVKLLGSDGDAGLIVRSGDEEEGVDSYQGYYAGLRTRDTRLVLGRADHDWKEETSAAVSGGVQAFRWYHLKVVAYDCQIVASATDPQDPAAVTAVAFNDKDCVRSGRIGLRSYSAGGAWKNVRTRVATYADLRSALARIPPRVATAKQALSPADMPLFGSGSRPSRVDTQPLAPAGVVQSIGSLRLASPWTSATIRGVVILTVPTIYVQDPTGGVAVAGSSIAPLKIGDEVQVTGKVEYANFTTRLLDARVNVLWPHTPVPPVSITTGQAATGAFDAMFVELEGSLRKKTRDPSNTVVLDLESDQQPFQAIVKVGRGDLLFRKMEPNSLLRLRGICVVDPEYTHHRLPFVLLLRSADDIEVIAGPPWWNTRHIVAIGLCILALTLLGHLAQNRVERWRLRTILEEREHLAHEMHDTLAQSFAGLGFQLEAIRDGVPQEIPAVHQQLDLACDLVRRSHQEARRSIAALRRDIVGHNDLLPALEHCARKMVEHCRVAVTVAQQGEIRPLSPPVSDALFRIGQEALANSVRHAQPTSIAIAVSYIDGGIELQVDDNGVGFQPDHASAGFGLQGIQKRAHRICATAHIISAPGAGTRVHVIAPLPPPITWREWPRHLWQSVLRYRSYAQAREHTYSRSYRG